MQKHVNLVDLVKSFPTNIYLQNLASIQKRTSALKFAHLAEKSGKGSISNLSTKVSLRRPLLRTRKRACASRTGSARTRSAAAVARADRPREVRPSRQGCAPESDRSFFCPRVVAILWRCSEALSDFDTREQCFKDVVFLLHHLALLGSVAPFLASSFSISSFLDVFVLTLHLPSFASNAHLVMPSGVSI